MLRKNPVPDKAINQKVARQLISHGFRAPCNIEAQTNRGVVTLSGKIEFEYQRAAVLRAIHQVDGISSVIDHLQVIPKTVQWK
jgi:osmotically-inducible protein OsmY